MDKTRRKKHPTLKAQLKPQSIGCGSQRLTDPAVLTHSPEVNRDQTTDDKRNRHAVQDVKSIQSCLTNEATTEQQELRVRSVGNQLITEVLNTWKPGPSSPRNGVALAMLEPTVMAQIANWSQGRR